MDKLRKNQQEIVSYRGGKMGIAAVPGSGKTFTLSRLAADLIASNILADDQEVLIVTLVNSAVDNFSSRIAQFISDYKMLPNIGYRVRTLHGLAHDILKERPDLVGLSNHFQIVEERESQSMIEAITQNWMHLHPEFTERYLNPEVDFSKNHNARSQWHDMLTSLAGNFIRLAKDQQLMPMELQKMVSDLPELFPLLRMGSDIYCDYHRALTFRAAVDFDDLIQLALKTISSDQDFLHRLQYRWPFVLEDEAQDSSHLQEEILRLLTNQQNNWVRVGDTNQAIYETFTTANPEYLRNFLKEIGVIEKYMPESGRSTLSVIELANYLISWVNSHHPDIGLRNSLLEPFIHPVPFDDPKPNPPDNPAGIRISSIKREPTEEARLIVQDIQKWLPDHEKETVAILVPRNERGAEIVEMLKTRGIPYLELLKSSYSTRQIAKVLSNLLNALAAPTASQKLAEAFKMIFERIVSDGQKPSVQKAAAILRKFTCTEDYLSPSVENDLLSDQKLVTELAAKEMLEAFRKMMQKWSDSVLLPIDQMILAISQDLFHDPIELALVHKLALILEQMQGDHPDWSLAEFAEQLETIAKNERKFLGFSEEDTGFNPDAHPGEVVVATIHKAKGLEWDRVSLLSVNNYDFPSNQPGDSYFSEKWYVRDHLNLEAECLDQLTALVEKDMAGLAQAEGEATQKARLQYCSERLRLLFVGMTRARKELTITWNTGRRGNCEMAIPLRALIQYREERSDAAS